MHRSAVLDVVGQSGLGIDAECAVELEFRSCGCVERELQGMDMDVLGFDGLLKLEVHLPDGLLSLEHLFCHDSGRRVDVEPSVLPDAVAYIDWDADVVELLLGLVPFFVVFLSVRYVGALAGVGESAFYAPPVGQAVADHDAETQRLMVTDVFFALLFRLDLSWRQFSV